MIWKLTPIDPDDPRWQSSTHRGHALVRAPSERQARVVAQRAFGAATRFTRSTPFTVAVWQRSECVRADVVDSTRHPPDGPCAVLEPSFDTDLAAQRRPKDGNSGGH